MKKAFFLAGNLLLSSISIAQTYSAPASAGDNGVENVHLGEQAGAGTYNQGDYNVFLGYQSGYNNLEKGGSNVFVGHQSGLNNTEGFNLVLLGKEAGYNNTTATGNVFIGTFTGHETTTGAGNVFIGYKSGHYNINGEQNCFLGWGSGINSHGNKNVFLGCYAARMSQSSYNSVALGYMAGYQAGNSNVFLGYKAGYFEQANNKLYIANDSTSVLIYGEFDSKELKLNANKVGIGTDFGSFPTLTGLANAANYRLFVRGGILAEEVRVRLQADWADYVFSDNYKLPSLKETEAFINENKHLPNMPSAKQVEEQGLEMGNIIKLQQEKIEELTLYLIQQEKEIQKLKEQNNQLEDLKAKVEFLLNKE